MNSRKEWIKAIEAYTRPNIGTEGGDPLHPLGGQQNMCGERRALVSANLFENDDQDLNEGAIDRGDREGKELGDFRVSFMGSQMFSYLRSRLECDLFESILEDAGFNPGDLSNDTIFSGRVEDENHIWSQEETLLTLRRIGSESYTIPAQRESSVESESIESRPHLSSASSVDSRNKTDLSTENSDIQFYLRKLSEMSIYSEEEERPFGVKTKEKERERLETTPSEKSPGDMRASIRTSLRSPLSFLPWVGQWNGEEGKEGRGEGSSSKSATSSVRQEKEYDEKTKRLRREIIKVAAIHRSCEDHIIKNQVENRQQVCVNASPNLDPYHDPNPNPNPNEQVCVLLEEEYEKAKGQRKAIIPCILVKISEKKEKKRGVGVKGTGTGDGENTPSLDDNDPKTVNENWFQSVWEKLSNDDDRWESYECSERFVAVLTAQIEEAQHPMASTSHLIPVINGLLGYLYEGMGDDDEALRKYSSCKLVESSRAMKCIVRKFLSLRIEKMKCRECVDIGTERVGETQSVCSPHQEMLAFLKWAIDIDIDIGLQAYRLLSALMHRRLVKRFSEALTVQVDESMVLGSQRFFPSNLDGEGAVFGRELLYGKFNRRRDALSVNVQEKEFTSRLDNKGSGSLNEIVTWSHSSTTPCALSISLLTKLKEILKAALEYEQNIPKSGTFKVLLTQSVQNALRASSAFKSFERDSCELQMADISSLSSTDEKILFWVNIHNVMMIHSLISCPITRNFGERFSLLRNSKYNIGGYLFSIIDVEHGVLRARSVKPAIFGPIVASFAFSDKDIRKRFALTEPCPEVSFALFTALTFSPALHVIKDARALRNKLSKCTQLYLQDNISTDKVVSAFRTIYQISLPEVFKVYWKDFGHSQNDVVSWISRRTNLKQQKVLETLLTEDHSFRLSFTSFEWQQTYFILP